jgi:TetR/AcrR family transcriptional regulator, ethionamide resistance regulator
LVEKINGGMVRPMSSPEKQDGPDRVVLGRRARKVSGDDRESAILRTVETLLQEKSLQEISIDELARSAGISRPTFYFYFASKEAALGVLIERVVTEARRERGQALQRLAEDPQQRWRDAIAAFYDTFSRHRGVLLAGVEARTVSPEVREIWSIALDGIIEEIAGAIDAEIARGAAPGGLPARDLATALTLMTERVFESTIAEHNPSVPKRNVIDVLTAAWIGSVYGSREVAPLGTSPTE